ncbi:Mur ligase C-terminal, partial [Penicillium herquei]
MGWRDRFKKWQSKGSTDKQTPASSPRLSKSTDKPATSIPQEVIIRPEDSSCAQPTDNTKATHCPIPNGIGDPVEPEERSSPALSEPNSVTSISKDTSPDLWQLSFDIISTEEQGRLNALLKTDLALSSDLTSTHFTSQSFDELIPITSAKQVELSNRAWEFEIRGRKIKPGEYTGRIIDCLSAVGDVGVGFMPQPASIVWPLVKGFMQIPVNADAETAAVLMTADLLVRTITCGRGYESVYASKVEKLGTELWKALQSALMELYVASLKLLALAFQQCEKGTARCLVEAFLSPQKTQGYVSNVQDCHSNLRQVVQSCQAKTLGDIDGSMAQLLENFADLNKFVGNNFDELFEQIEGRSRTEILDWISEEKPFDRHSVVVADRTPETCGWLLKAKDFTDWKEKFAPAFQAPKELQLEELLLLTIIAGTGKTFLTSGVIDHLYESLQPEEGLAFYYCRRSGDKFEDPDNIIRSIFRQLATRALQANSNQMRKDVQDLFFKSKDQISRAQISTCKLQILKSLDQYSQITLVIDALDECAEPKKELFDLIESMVSQSKCPVRVFLSARPNFGVEDRFFGKATIKTELNQVGSDIEKFIFLDWDMISEEVQVRAIDSLKQKSEGMFQWVALHIKQLSTCEMDDDVDLQIEKMPKGLLGTYQQIYDQISIHSSQKTIVDRAFLWLMYSNEAMYTEELLDAVCYGANHNYSEKKLGRDKFLKLCKNLVVFDESANRFRFCHASVSEYIADSLWPPENAHCYAAKTCLRFLLLMYAEPADATRGKSQPGSDEITSSDDEMVYKESVPFFRSRIFRGYCRHNWFHHVQRCEAVAPDPGRLDPNLISLLKSFLKSPLQSGQVYKSWCRDIMKEDPFLYDGLSPSSLPILAMCRFAIGTSLLADGWWSINEEISSQVNSENDTLLILAVQGGSLQICEALVESNAPLEHPGRFYSALHHAARLNRPEIAQLLLENGAAVDLKSRQSTGTPLILAAEKGSLQIVQLLVEKGADVNSVNSHKAALNVAVENGYLEIAALLIDNGADVNFGRCLPAPMDGDKAECSYDKTPLESAIWGGQLEATQLLIKHGADVTTKLNGTCGSALAVAARCGNLAIAELLINHGADVNMTFGDSHYSALANAVLHSENVDIVELLINHGADVDLVWDGNYGSALAAVAEYGELSTAEILIKHGANVNMTLNGKYGSALAAAARHWNSEMMQFLIDKGAQPNMLFQSGSFGSALAFVDRADYAQILVDNGASVDLPLKNGFFGSALAAAAATGNAEMIDYLLNQGANVNMPLVNGIYGSALNAACHWGHEDLVRRLLAAGAIIYLPQEHSGFKDAFDAVETEISYMENPFPDYSPRRKKRAVVENYKRAVKQLLLDH